MSASGAFVQLSEVKIVVCYMDERIVNKSAEAPIEGVYRYELIPAEKPIDYYIDLWYQYGMGESPETLLNIFEDAVYLKQGEYVEIDCNGNVMVRKKERHLKLVINNG